MGWFSKKNDPVESFKKQLLQAVHIGDVDLLSSIIKTDLELPPKAYAKALEQAIKDHQLRIVEVILDNKQNIPLDKYVLRSVIQNEENDMFRTLNKSYDFRSLIIVTQDSPDTVYKLRLRYLEKNLRCQEMEEAFVDLKKALLDQNGGSLPEKLQEQVKKFDNNEGFKL